MFDILNAAPCPLQDFPQRRLSFGKWFSPQVFTIERQQVESERDGTLIIYPTMQGVEIRHTIRTNPHELGIKYRGPVDSVSTLDNQRIAFQPICAVDGVEPHSTVTNVDLQPIAIMFQLVRPTRSAWRSTGYGGTTGNNESGGRVSRPTARITHTLQHVADI